MRAIEHLPLSWKDLGVRTGKAIINNNLLDLAAQQAYYFFFALFPALLTLISIASFFPVANLVDESVAMLGRIRAGDVSHLIADQMRKISESNHGGVLTFAFLLTLWSTSGALVSIITTLNAAYGITEGRPLWKVRPTAIGLTIGMSFFILLSMALVLAGPAFAEHLANSMHLGRRVQMGLVGVAMAGRVRPRGIGDWSCLLLRARRGAGLDLDHSRLGGRDGAVGDRVGSRSSCTSRTLATTTRPTARLAPLSSC